MLTIHQFKEELINVGFEGGKHATNIWRNTVFERFKALTEDTEMIARVYTNVGGLAKAIERDGSLDNLDDLKDFALGFTYGKASLDFIDEVP